jgi:polysaccharide biosynthesis protein PslH
MNILVVSPWLPYPETWGAAIRLANTVRGLARLGEIDLFVIEEQRPDGVPDLPAAWHVRRVNVVVTPPRRISPLQRLRWLVRGPLPRRFLGLDYTDIRAAFERWRAKTYDLAWLYQVECPVILGGLLPPRAIVDINDLEDYKIAARLNMERLAARQERRAPSQQLRRAGDRLLTRRDLPLWRALQAQVARAVDAIVVCSEVDRQRIGVSNAHVIVNGYQEQVQPLGRVAVGNPPTVLFIGLFDYAPNVDAAAFLVNEILPELRSRIPSVRVRLVGHASERVRALQRPPEVVVTGFVPEIAPELARADLIVVPVRYGGGTRIKILEAFAHRIPVVSTEIGAEGIDAVRGREIMLEDSADGFAQACAALLTDAGLRQRVTEAAHRLFLARYRWDQMQDDVQALAAQVAGGRARGAAG